MNQQVTLITVVRSVPVILGNKSDHKNTSVCQAIHRYMLDKWECSYVSELLVYTDTKLDFLTRSLLCFVIVDLLNESSG